MFNFHDKFARTIGVVIVAVIIVAGVFWFMRLKITRDDQAAEPTPVNQIQNYEADEKPNQFPSSIPIEAGAKIISNYNATSPDGRLQSTQVFQSNRSMTANFDLYKSHLTRTGWKLISQDSSNPNLRLIIAQNDSGIINVTIHKGTDPSKSTVDLSFVAN